MAVDVLSLLNTTEEGLAWVPFGGGPVLPVVSTGEENPGNENPTPGVVTPRLLFSKVQTREFAKGLDGETVSGNIYVFVSEQGVAGVTFDKGLPSERTENTAPFDYKGGQGVNALPFTPEIGLQTVHATVRFLDPARALLDISATFTGEEYVEQPNPQLIAPTLSAPQALTFSVNLSWTLVEGATGYRVYRDSVMIRDLPGTLYTDSGLTAGVSYNYQVEAYNAVGVGPKSAPQAATPTASTGGGVEPIGFKPSGLNVGFGTGGNTSVLQPMSGGTFPGGTVLENKHITGRCVFTGPNWRLFNCRIDYQGSSPGALYTPEDENTNGVIERCTINADGSYTKDGKVQGIIGIMTRNGTIARYNSIRASADGIKAWNHSLYEHNWIYMARPPNSSVHLDGIQGSGKSYWTARGNFIDVDHNRGGNFSIFCQGYNGSIDKDVYDVLIENNWVSAGNRATATGSGKTSSGRLHNVVIRGNRYMRRGRYYPNVHQQEDDTRFDWSTNVWDDTGTPIRSASGAAQV